MLALKARFYSWRGAMTPEDGYSPWLIHDVWYLRTTEKDHQKSLFESPTIPIMNRKDQLPAKIPEALCANSPKLSADENLAKDVIALFLHS